MDKNKDNKDMDDSQNLLPGLEPQEPEADVIQDEGHSMEEDTLNAMMSTNFLEYASYVVRDRAIPDVDDGLKPVQRRILYCLHKVDDGRFNKVAGIVGDTMHYHPHGDQSIGDALIVLANKEYFIDRQGNFGNIVTGDSAAAPRYIECRLSEMGREVLFNPDLTEMVDAYDGRSKEPVCLPAKVPALLMLGTDGIAVGMATRIFPHNFRELLEAQIAILEERPFQLFPDFPQGGLMDASQYDDGRGSITLRARIEAEGDKKIIIREIPAMTTTEALMASIEKAARANKIKIAGINDYTSKEVAIEITLPRNVYAEDTIRELYAFTDCEMTVSSMMRVILDNQPTIMSVSDILRRNTEKLKLFLHREQELRLERLELLYHDKTLAQIFVEFRIYKRIEKCPTLEQVYAETRKGLEAHKDRLRREITDDDISKLLQIPIRRISLFDINKNEQELQKIESDIADTRDKLAHIVRESIAFIRHLLEKYGDLYPRHTQIAAIDKIDAREVARANLKVSHDKVNHFLGTAVKASNKDSAPISCTEFDKLMLLRNDGTCRVIAIPEKEYIGPTKYVFIYNKDQVYSLLYRDRSEGIWYLKRFCINQFILGKEYHVLPPNCIIEALYTASGVEVTLNLAPNKRRSYHSIPIKFNDYALRAKEARGYKITIYPVESITVTNKGSADGTASDTSADAEAAATAEPTNDTTAASAETAPETAVSSEVIAQEGVTNTEGTEKPADESPNGGKAAPSPKKSLRKLIDEDTPFFLE